MPAANHRPRPDHPWGNQPTGWSRSRSRFRVTSQLWGRIQERKPLTWNSIYLWFIRWGLGGLLILTTKFERGFEAYILPMIGRPLRWADFGCATLDRERTDCHNRKSNLMENRLFLKDRWMQISANSISYIQSNSASNSWDFFSFYTTKNKNPMSLVIPVKRGL